MPHLDCGTELNLCAPSQVNFQNRTWLDRIRRYDKTSRLFDFPTRVSIKATSTRKYTPKSLPSMAFAMLCGNHCYYAWGGNTLRCSAQSLNMSLDLMHEMKVEYYSVESYFAILWISRK